MRKKKWNIDGGKQRVYFLDNLIYIRFPCEFPLFDVAWLLTKTFNSLQWALFFSRFPYFERGYARIFCTSVAWHKPISTEFFFIAMHIMWDASQYLHRQRLSFTFSAMLEIILSTFVHVFYFGSQEFVMKSYIPLTFSTLPMLSPLLYLLFITFLSLFVSHCVHREFVCVFVWFWQCIRCLIAHLLYRIFGW